MPYDTLNGIYHGHSGYEQQVKTKVFFLSVQTAQIRKGNTQYNWQEVQSRVVEVSRSRDDADLK